MKKISLKNIYRLCIFSLRTHKKLILAWSFAIFSIMTLYMILFSSIQEMAEIKMEAMPQELLQFVGMEDFSEMSNYVSYFGIIFGIVLVAIAIFGASYSSSLITKEEKSKSIEFLSTLPISRTEIFVANYFSSTIAVAITLYTAVFATIICGFIQGGESFVLADVIQISKICSFIPLLFSAISLGLAGISSKIASGTFCSMVVLGSYMLGYLGTLLNDDGKILSYASPFISLSAEKSLELSSETIIILLIYFAIYFTFLFVGNYFYSKRDLNV
ncbi:MAG: ABC transporter permease subunit [Clostridia bacterium]